MYFIEESFLNLIVDIPSVHTVLLYFSRKVEELLFSILCPKETNGTSSKTRSSFFILFDYSPKYSNFFGLDFSRVFVNLASINKAL